MKPAHLEIEIEPKEKAAAPDITAKDLGSLDGLDDGVFRVPGQPCPAEHDGVPSRAKRVGVNVAQVRWV